MEIIELDIEDLVEIRLEEDDDFLKVKETLTRMGVSSKTENKLFQSCHILHKRGKYYIVHFKELFSLDGLPTDISETDIGRRNIITNLLDEWGLLEIVDKNKTSLPLVSLAQLKIISYNDKDNWELIPKYHIGRRR